MDTPQLWEAPHRQEGGGGWGGMYGHRRPTAYATPSTASSLACRYHLWSELLAQAPAHPTVAPRNPPSLSPNLLNLSAGPLASGWHMWPVIIL